MDNLAGQTIWSYHSYIADFLWTFERGSEKCTSVRPYVYEFHMTRTLTSDVFWTQGLTGLTTDLDSIRESARSIIANKDAEIARLNREIDETERMLDEEYQTEVDGEASLKDEIAMLEQELNHISVSSQAELQALRARHEHEIEEVKSGHAREVGKLQKDLQRAQTESGQRRPSDFAEDAEGAAARARGEQLQAEVRRLEAELRQITTEQQQQIAAQARAVEDVHAKVAHESELSGQRLEFKEEIREAKAKLKKAKERNAQLDKTLADLMAQNAQKQAEITALKSRTKRKPARPIIGELTVVDAEIIRLADENEDLKVILQGLDRIAYDSHR
jgi:chromosome segregation ATPase